MRRSEVLDRADIERVLKRLAHEVIERNQGSANLDFIGIATGGSWLADDLAELVSRYGGDPVSCFELSIEGFRDDKPRTILQSERLKQVDGARVVLVDDVLHTGRTVRAAMEAIVSTARPQLVQLAVLVDRGHRELPIRADFVGKSLPTRGDEFVEVSRDGVVIVSGGE